MTHIFLSVRKLHLSHTLALCLFALAVALTGVATASAQEITGVITGKVTDAHGTAISGASLVAIDVDRDKMFSATSDAKGIYHLTGLPLGRYDVISSMPGYHTWKHHSFKLSFHQIARINVSMGNTCEVCGSEPETPLLQTDSAEMRITIDGSVLSALQ